MSVFKFPRLVLGVPHGMSTVSSAGPVSTFKPFLLCCQGYGSAFGLLLHRMLLEEKMSWCLSMSMDWLEVSDVLLIVMRLKGVLVSTPSSCA